MSWHTSVTVTEVCHGTLLVILMPVCNMSKNNLVQSATLNEQRRSSKTDVHPGQNTHVRNYVTSERRFIDKYVDTNIWLLFNTMLYIEDYGWTSHWEYIGTIREKNPW